VKVLLFHPGGKGKLKDHLDVQLWPFLDEHIIPFPEKGILPGSYLRRSYVFSQRISAAIEQEEDLDFIYAQGFSAWDLIDKKRKGKKLPPIGLNFHGLEMFQKAEGFKQRLIQRYFQGPVRFNMEHADVCYSLGARLTELIKKEVPKANISEIPIGLEASWAEGSMDKSSLSFSPKKLVFIGRNEHRKGLHILFELLGERNFDGLEFHFIGAVSAPSDIKNQPLIFHGEIRDENKIKAILDQSHGLLIPSLSEGMPTVILEAMSRGLPILASDVGAVNEQVNTENGILFPAGSKQELGKALEEFLNWNEATWKSKSERSRERFLSSYTWENVILRTLQDMEKSIS
jgi:glycosyltransferase involved in cell wall biosynthesis